VNCLQLPAVLLAKSYFWFVISLSAVIITKNEEKNIERCLKSLQGVADEIVILDSFSTDNTREISERYGAKFFQHAFDGHIEQKNRAITYASSPYVLSLDGDEALDETLRQSIIEVKKNFVKEGYYMNRLTNYCGHWVRHCGWYPDRKLRLWDSRKGKWGGSNPHDKYEMKAGDGVTGRLRGNILHYSYYSREDHYRQVKYFTDIASRAACLEGKKAPWFKLILNPAAKFIDHYLLKLGFLDGAAGWNISKISAYATWLKYRRLRELIAGKRK
jgi:glycosyltransferase involved in cell wall biosynthesis